MTLTQIVFLRMQWAVISGFAIGVQAAIGYVVFCFLTGLRPLG